MKPHSSSFILITFNSHLERSFNLQYIQSTLRRIIKTHVLSKKLAALLMLTHLHVVAFCTVFYMTCDWSTLLHFSDAIHKRYGNIGQYFYSRRGEQKATKVAPKVIIELSLRMRHNFTFAIAPQRFSFHLQACVMWVDLKPITTKLEDRQVHSEF